METHESGLKISGAPSLDELREAAGYRLPDAGTDHPVAVIECIEEIPCNPCETACPRHAITVGDEITGLPVVDMDRCTGCGICVAACPGLAIYLKQRRYAEGLSYIAFPFEYLPLPDPGQQVDMVNRYGDVVCRGTVVRVVKIKRNDRTTVVHVSYPQEYFESVVNMRRLV